MNFFKYLFITLLIIVMVCGAGYLFASSGIKSKPGYAKLTTPGWLASDMVVAIDLGPGGMKPLRWVLNTAITASEQNLDLPEQVLVRLLQDIDGLQLRVYDVQGNEELYDDALAESVAALKQNNWHTLVKVNEDDERVVVMHSGTEELISGLTVLVRNRENAVFMNIIGELNPQSIAEIVANVKR